MAVAFCRSRNETFATVRTELLSPQSPAGSHLRGPHFGIGIAFRKGGECEQMERRQIRPSASVRRRIMTVLLVIMTFAVLLLIDHYYTRKRLVIGVKQEAAPPQREVLMPARLQPSLVGGFQVPENLRYHPGHTWALNESPTLVRVGLDDFASKLAGKIERITLPQRGQWIRQGQKIWSLHRDGSAVDMVSPVEGSVAEINEAVLQDPELASRDPYGEGWVVTVQSPDAKTNFRN